MEGSPPAVASPVQPKMRGEELNSTPEAEIDTGATKNNDGGEEGDQDTASLKTTTADLFSEYEVDAQSRPESKDHKLGLDINKPWGWDGSQYNDYDVITVHGIRDDYRTAWTDVRGDWWVNYGLFRKLSIREIDYSYEIDPTSTLYERDGIVQHARNLIDRYAAVRQKLEETETDRPVIWICHDLGGTIVKEALYMAMQNPARYGKIAILTTTIIFLGTPHRFQSAYDLQDQLCKLVLLPGPSIRDGTLSKVELLARQVTSANQRFLATKLLDRAIIFNLFTHHKLDSAELNTVDTNSETVTAASVYGREDDDAASPVTPFRRYTHHLGQSFEVVGRFRIEDSDHVALVRGEKSGDGFSWLSALFNKPGFDLKVNYRILHLQARILSLAPPTRALDSPFNPERPKVPIVKWIYEQEPCVNFSESGGGFKFLQLHANGNPLIDISNVSRLFYLDYDSSAILDGDERRPEKTTVYFEFDQNDSRYNNVSSLLLYLLNILVWRFSGIAERNLSEELAFLSRVNAWSPEDLFHLYSMMKCVGAAAKLTIFISCFDQCPADQRKWFLGRLQEERSFKDDECRIIISTSGKDKLIKASFPEEADIDLNDSPVFENLKHSLTEDFRTGLDALVTKRAVYEDFRPQIESLLEKCGDVPYLGRVVLSWLENSHRGKPRSGIREIINKLSPPNAENFVRVFIDSLSPALQSRAETIFNWVKNAAEPWSPKSLTEALAVYELGGVELSFDDLDVERTMDEIREGFGGIIDLRDGDVKFSHAAFYQVPDLGFEGSTEDAAAKANSTIAETCLRYFQLHCAQEVLAALSRANLDPEGVSWATPLDSAVMFHSRTTMAEYAVRFWHHHYMRSGKFKPKQLVYDLFANKKARASWEMPFWLLSNPFTRTQRSYISSLPMLAMLGLEDLVRETVQNEKDRPTIAMDCWLAITEAVRAGSRRITHNLLRLVAVNEKELQIALHWAASRGDRDIINLLINKIPNLETFQWPESMIHQAAAAGLDDLLRVMLRSGCDINSTNLSIYWNAPPAAIAAWRNNVSTMKILLGKEYKADLTIMDKFGDNPLMTAVQRGNPDMIDMLLQSGASVEINDRIGMGPVQRAAHHCCHKAIGVMIRAKADLKSSTPRPALIIAAKSGSQQCVRILLAHGADLGERSDGVTALYEAVSGGHTSVVRQLLSHNSTLDMEESPTSKPKLLMCAVETTNATLVSLLVDNGAEINCSDPNASGFNKTPLSQASAQGSLDIVKLLLEKGADINYTGDASDAPLLAAVYEDRLEVAKHLLQYDTVDVKWAAPDGTTSLHVAFRNPSLIPKLLEKGSFIDAQSFGGTPLHRAAHGNSPKAIEALLANDPKPDLDAVCDETSYTNDYNGLTPLQLACKYHMPKCVKVLLRGGANSKLKNTNGEDVVDILLHTESESDDALECLRLVLSLPTPVPVDDIDSQGRSRLHGIREKTPLSIVQLLVEAKAPFDHQDEDGHSPLTVAVKEGNESVLRYLVRLGASVNRFGPSFGSTLHLAVNRGDLNIARFLVESGAELDAVHPDYGESVLYTALGIEDPAKLKAMVRYLVDEAKVPINKPGGSRFSYPIIRAANIVRNNHSAGMQVLKFLIRRKAQLDVADRQGRRAAHVACASQRADAIEALIKAGAKINVEDDIGRTPIHFAVSTSDTDCFQYLLDTFGDADIHDADDDNWTPLMWAARSGSVLTINKLLDRDADVWARGRGLSSRDEWSALKLFHFSGRTIEDGLPQLKPKERTRVKLNGDLEEWDNAFHKVKTGDLKDARCDSCFVFIRGIQWKCISCNDDFSLCFKCFDRRPTIHPDHEFDGLPPLYRQDNSLPDFYYSDENDD